ncbi:hypothetical protein AVO45_13860 [Ruegeria marisrubri]|uniref:Uncharacterized protein n=1 Tax=Ruegeria marisrubri TaxID=1685379 RepID=A0A0X3TD18_9RHOB|nr:hypothetical protein [Ruegeria marisrubri]KUJ73677.1 hypothetical protein AVO45_13860 [Ruegeria marisrubri]
MRAELGDPSWRVNFCTEGCCGRGCNGCLIFWQDPQYARAREVLLKRRQGAQLSRAEAAELKEADAAV